MKKHLLLVIILFKISNISIAQTYYPFPTNSGVWNLRITQDFLDPGAIVSYIMEGDTLFNTISYKKLLVFNDIYGGIREENKIIYFYSIAYQSEYIIYDFTKQVGDTIYGIYDDIYSYPEDPESFHSLIVTSIDSILLSDGNYHKRFLLSAILSAYEVYWIEGVGSPVNIISPAWNSSSVSGEYQLECLVGDGNLVYGACTSGILENSQNEFINIYPNPFSDFTNVFSKTPLKNATLNIYNSYGKLVNELKNIYGETFAIQRNNLPEGFYTIQLLQDNKVIANKKLVVSSSN